jgi:hypothetical protein
MRARVRAGGERDERGERTYVTEHQFLERPDVETVKCLFDEARPPFLSSVRG